MEKGADNLNRLPALSETPKNNTGGRRTATLEHDPDPEGRPARAATAWCEHMSSSLISLCRSCAQNASGSHLHLLRVGTQSRLAPKRRHRTDEKMGKADDTKLPSAFRRDPGKQQAQEIRRPQDCFPVSPDRSAGVDPIDSFV